MTLPGADLYWCNGVRKNDWGNRFEYAMTFRRKKDADSYLLIVLAENFNRDAVEGIKVAKVSRS